MKVKDILCYLAGYTIQVGIILGGFFLIGQGEGSVGSLAMIAFGMYWAYEWTQELKAQMLTEEIKRQQHVNFDLSNIKIKKK